MKNLPANFDAFVEKLLPEVATVEGYLAPNEMRFLALVAACPTATGEILEIGSFKGKSTVILAKAAALAGKARVHAVDPMTAPAATDKEAREALGNEASSLGAFQRNIERHDVADKIEFHQAFSFDLAKTWNKPLRLLWIDGDHSYKGVKLDFDCFSPHLADGAIIAFHDVLHRYDGGLRVFMEDILLSPNFGACGFCGSIAWAQYHTDDAKGWQHAREKRTLYKKLSPLVPLVVFQKKFTAVEKLKYKLYRALVPHGAVKSEAWARLVA
jgi:predicted O-methyltransferase YrrM